jgi:hypothetical protein
MAAQKVALKCRADFQRFSRIWTPTAEDLVAASADVGLSRKFHLQSAEARGPTAIRANYKVPR